MMKLCSITIAVLALWAGPMFAQAAPQITAAGRPVLWSIHFDAERLRSGAGRELFASIDPLLTALSGDHSSAPGGKLESLTILGLQPQQGDADTTPSLADLNVSPDGGGISRRFEAISRKRGLAIVDLAGSPTIHFSHEGKEVWIAKFGDNRLFLGTSRDLLESALKSGGTLFAAVIPQRPDEMLGGKVEIKSLLAGNSGLRDSELLKLLPQIEFHLFSDGAQLDLDASAELDSERSARRASRMVDGMVAALSMHDSGGVPWDERLTLKQDGPRLAAQLHLDAREARKMFDSFAREIEIKIKAANRDQ